MPETTTTETPAASEPSPGAGRTATLISASALMAAGTLLSRVLGFGRLMLLVFLFGNATRQADMFTIANTVPNSMYILLAGGVLNTVLVPQIVRAIKGDEDGGEAYTNRIMTAGLLALAAIAAVLTVAAPLVIWLYSSAEWRAPGVAPQYHSMIMLAYYCMPQIFFYGVHVLAGQVLNARDRFGPMMWAPIANNVVSIVVLGLFLAVFGRGNTAAPFSTGEELLLGLGSTLGIAVQAAVLVPFLRAAGYHFRPRFDFRGVGLGKTFRLAKWTLGFVLVTQLALVVVSKLATRATAGGAGAGLTAYYNAYALWILPHSLITVSLATAMLPAASRMAANTDLDGVAAETTRAIRLALTALLPAAVAFLTLGVPLAQLLFGFGQGARDASFVGWALMALGLGLVPFTVQYLCLRAYYALEDTRTPFFLQILISGANVLLGLAAVALVDRPSLVAAALGLAYAVSYLLGVGVSLTWLRRRLPALDTFALLQHCVRLLVAVTPAALAAVALVWTLGRDTGSQLGRALVLALAGIVAVGIFLLAARLLKVAEVTAVLALVLHRGRKAPQLSSVDAPAGDRTDTPATGAGPADDLVTTGDSETVIRLHAPTIDPLTTAGPASQPPTGTTENADSMAQAAIVRRHPEDEADLGDASLLPDPTDHGVDDTTTTKAATLPAGTVLGTRYRLEELLAVSGPAITWRAFDQVLSRSVLVHLLPPGDAVEADLMTAARRASVATDSRFLRVLDAVQSTDPELGSYIVCEYATGQSLEVILSQGPLSGLEAAWVIREVADALSGVHSLGLHHRRISPDTVIITPTGNVKIVGLLIEAALRPARHPVAPQSQVPAADAPELVDVLDLGRLLYATLVCRWPGGPGYNLLAAPTVGRRWLTPRQVRAGVSPALDNICDQILGDPPRHRAPQITDANALVNALTKVLGTADASGDLERRLRQPIPRVGAHQHAVGATPVSTLLDQPTEPNPVVQDDDDEPVQPRTAAADASPLRISQPVAAPPAGSTVASATTTVIRTPVPQQQPPHRPRPVRRPRRWIALLVMLVVLLSGVGLVAGLVLSNQLSAAPVPGPSATPARAPAAPASAVLPISTGRDFDPQGDPNRENPDEVRLAYDGDPATRWRTVAYIGSPKLGNLKRGVGLVLDLGSAQPVASVQVSLSGSGTDLDLRVPRQDPAATTSAPLGSDRDWRVVAEESGAGRSATLTPEQPVTTRFVLVYLTALPNEGGRYRGGISEVEVRR
jgi:putative peptidoglycan lipid II flippase